MKLVIFLFENNETVIRVMIISSIFLETCEVKCWLKWKMAQLVIMQDVMCKDI